MTDVAASGAVSPDGTQWWDGAAWHPVPTKDGPIIVFAPLVATTIAAIFAHGVEDGTEIAPVGGVTLGYYSPHGSTLTANVTWAQGAPGHAPQRAEGDPTGQWASYVLTTIGVPKPAELAPTANDYGIAIAYVVDPTSTHDVVSQLAGLGYSEVRGVHCREALGAVDDATFGAAVEITHATLIADGWQDSGMEAFTEKTKVEVGDPVINPGGSYFKIASIVEPGVTYTIEPYGG